MKRLTVFFLCAALTAGSVTKTSAQSLEEQFHKPQRQAKPVMIWQWMDGLVTKEGITADLEAYAAAGLGGVQNFQVGGTTQMLRHSSELRRSLRHDRF